MRAITTTMVLGALVACGGGDECEQFWNKTKPMMEKVAKERGKSIGDAEKSKFLDECRKARKENKGGEEEKKMFDCVLKASGDAEIAGCMAPAFGDYMKKSKKTEAELLLNKIGKMAKVSYIEKATFPVGTSAAMPAGPCCGQPTNKCAVAPASAWAADAVWSELDFTIEEPTLFTYKYESTDGKTFTATAVGDLDCDTNMITYTLKGSAVDGNPQVELVPPSGSD